MAQTVAEAAAIAGAVSQDCALFGRAGAQGAGWVAAVTPHGAAALEQTGAAWFCAGAALEQIPEQPGFLAARGEHPVHVPCAQRQQRPPLSQIFLVGASHLHASGFKCFQGRRGCFMRGFQR